MRKKKNCLLGILLVLAMALTMPGMTTEAYAAGTKSERDIVIVLDPGHGGADGGATRRWSGKTYQEKKLNLSIAKACKKKLESYAGVRVYLTRSSDRYVGLGSRVSYAKGKKADIFVSLHNNASLKSKDNGACVIYPNSSYKKTVGKNGKDAAQCIQNQLTGLGLKNNGVYYRNTAVGSRYPDRSRADYYKVIKDCKLAGIPGIIVEHAYVSNSGDCKKYLKTEDQLRMLGEADALGLAEYFDLVEDVTPELTQAQAGEDKAVQLCWNPLNEMDGYKIYRRVAGEKKFTCIATVTGDTSYSDLTAEAGVTYEYCIGAYHTGRTAVSLTSKSGILSVTMPVQEETGGDTEEAQPKETQNL
ncbi:MAG: N-acetylmuramoyl-L-alanine amidase [Lachnospiraceae bacterium]|nr:N-acetylmuramoyl-L-alanine amidase [Lachnospiraceae bacterium]